MVEIQNIQIHTHTHSHTHIFQQSLEKAFGKNLMSPIDHFSFHIHIEAVVY